MAGLLSGESLARFVIGGLGGQALATVEDAKARGEQARAVALRELDLEGDLEVESVRAKAAEDIERMRQAGAFDIAAGASTERQALAAGASTERIMLAEIEAKSRLDLRESQTFGGKISSDLKAGRLTAEEADEMRRVGKLMSPQDRIRLFELASSQALLDPDTWVKKADGSPDIDLLTQRVKTTDLYGPRVMEIFNELHREYTGKDPAEPDAPEAIEVPGDDPDPLGFGISERDQTILSVFDLIDDGKPIDSRWESFADTSQYQRSEPGSATRTRLRKKYEK